MASWLEWMLTNAVISPAATRLSTSHIGLDVRGHGVERVHHVADFVVLVLFIDIGEMRLSLVDVLRAQGQPLREVRDQHHGLCNAVGGVACQQNGTDNDQNRQPGGNAQHNQQEGFKQGLFLLGLGRIIVRQLLQGSHNLVRQGVDLGQEALVGKLLVGVRSGQ